MCDDYPEIVGTDTLKRCWVLLRSSTTNEDLGNVCRLLDADLRPLTPDDTCKRSREIFEEHKQIAQEYLKVQTEIALLSQHKNEMLKNLSIDSLRQQQELRKLEDEKESLLKLCRNLQRQLQIMKDQRIKGALTNAAAAAAAAAAATSKSLALPSSISQIPAAYAMTSPTAAAVAAALHAPAVTPAMAAAAPFLLFNVHPSHHHHHPHHHHHHHPRIPILRAPTSHGLLAPIAMAATPALNPAAIISLKRTWDATFPANAAANSVAAKRTTWHAPAAAFHAPAPTPATPHGLPYPAQFYPQI